MENLSGMKNDILLKSLCMKIVLFTYDAAVDFTDLIYALSCLELIDENGEKSKNMQGINPMLFIRKNIREALNIIYDKGLVYVENHKLVLSYSGEILVKELIAENHPVSIEYLNRKKYVTNYRSMYNEMIRKENFLDDYKKY